MATENKAPMAVICDKCRAEGAAGEGQFTGISGLVNFEPVPRRPQVGNWTPDQQRAFIVALALTGSPKRAGIAIGRDDRGAMKLRSAKGGESFSKAWDTALAIHREQQEAAERELMASRTSAAIAAGARFGASRSGMTKEEQEEAEMEAQRILHEEALARVRDRLLRARRLYLLTLVGDEAKQAAWEALCGPVDWDRAAKLQAQPNEPFQPRMTEPEMLLPAEGGCMPELVDVGRDRGQEFMEAMDEVRETGEVDGPKMQRFCG